jgi:hypothetical protein
MATIDWTIVTLERDPATGAVTVVHWRADATDGEHSAGIYGAEGFDPDPTAPGFIPFESLTEAKVLSWLLPRGDFARGEKEAHLLAQIEAQKNPPVLAGLPWAVQGDD